MATVDVTVYGAGIFGLSIAFICLERGARVRVIDPNGPGSGASGGIVGALAPHTPNDWNAKKAFQFNSLVSSEALWAQVAERGGVSPGYARTGRIQPLRDDRAIALAEARSADAAVNWGEGFRWKIVGAGELDWMPEHSGDRYLFDTLTARIHPARSCEALVSAIRAQGGEIVEDAEAIGCVVHATGWRGLLDLSRAFGRPVGNGVKGQAVLLRYQAPPEAPQIFVDGLHIVPHADGTLAIGSTSEREFDAPDTTDGAIDGLLERAMDALPALRDAKVIRSWAGVRPRAQSRAPLLGAWPGRPGHFIANGGFKIGFGVAWGVAEVVADLVLEGRDRIPQDFRPEAIGLS